MSLYYFHVRGGSVESEAEEGLEFPDRDAARHAAIAGARSIIADDVLLGQLDLSARLDVTDQRGNLAFSIPFEVAAGVR